MSQRRPPVPIVSDERTNAADQRRPVKVLIVDTAIAFGGTLAVARNLLKHIDPAAVDASLVSACCDGFVSKNFAGGATVRLLSPRMDYVSLMNWKGFVGGKLKWKPLARLVEWMVIIAGLLANLPYVLRLARLCRRLGVEVVHTNNYAAEPLWAARLAGLPIVYHLHGYLPDRLEGSTRDNFRHVTTFVSISQAVTASAVRAGIDRRRILHIPNFVERQPEVLPPAMPATATIGIFGRVIPWKGQKQFLMAALRVLPLFPNLRVLLVGGASDGDPSYMQECRRIAGSSPFSDRIEFTGLVTDVATYYRRCTIVVHASIEPEPFGMVLIEAMAEARPVIASPYGAAPEIVEQGVEGYIVDPYDAEAMAARMTELLARPEEAVSMGLRGHAKVRALYDPCLGARQFERLYRDVARPPLQHG
jgi:glycosyltransferase involved in cell wall biosynthesis